MDIPRAQPLPLNPVQPSLGGQAAEGLALGANIGYLNTQNKQLQLENQYRPQIIALKQQELAMQIQKQQAETEKAKADAINGIGQLAPVLKLLPIKDAKNLLASHIAKLQSIYPDLPVDPKNVTDDNVDEVQQWAAGRKKIEELASPEALQSYDAMWISKMGETQRDMVKDIKPVSPSEMFSQQETAKRTQENISAENTRAAATATSPMVNTVYSVNLAKHALTKKDELNDHIAINEFGKLVNNGTPLPLPELAKMVKSGTFGPRLKQVFANYTGEGALSDEQRTMIDGALTTFGEAATQQAGTRVATIPGTKPPKLPSISAYKVGQAVKFDEGTFKKVKDGPDTDPTVWQKVGP